MVKRPIASQRLIPKVPADKPARIADDDKSTSTAKTESSSPSREQQATEAAVGGGSSSTPGRAAADKATTNPFVRGTVDPTDRDPRGASDDPGKAPSESDPFAAPAPSDAAKIRAEVAGGVAQAAAETERGGHGATLDDLNQVVADAVGASPAAHLRAEVNSSLTESASSSAPDTGRPSVAEDVTTNLNRVHFDESEGVSGGSSKARENNPGLARVVDHILVNQREGAEYLLDEGSTKVGKDGTIVTHNGDGSTTVVKDGTSTTVHSDGTVVETKDGKTTTITPGEGEETTTANKAGTPDPDHEGAPLPAELQHLVDADIARLRAVGPQPAAGGGETDPIDEGEIAFGTGAGPVPDVKQTLLGGDTHGIEPDGGAGHDFGSSPTANGGNIDPSPDDETGPLTRGPEDDPFAGHGQTVKPSADSDDSNDTSDDSSDSDSPLFPVQAADLLPDDFDLTPTFGD